MTLVINKILDNKVTNLIQVWIEYLQNIRGYGMHTLNAYQRDVIDFTKFCEIGKYDVSVSYTHLTLPTTPYV